MVFFKFQMANLAKYHLINVIAPNFAHLSLLTSVGYDKK